MSTRFPAARPQIAALILLFQGSSCAEERPPPDEGPQPLLGEWETVVAALHFPLSGENRIQQIAIGRAEYMGNFANRGHVEILLDHPEETITIEMRKYTFGYPIDAFGDKESGTDGVFDRFSLWAFVSLGNPIPPEQQDIAKDCTKDFWKDRCVVYAYYHGDPQPARSGVDFRIHLPFDYRGTLSATTQDNVEEKSYPRRSDVRIEGLCGSAQIQLESGQASISLCRDISPSPTCDLSSIEICSGWPDGSGSEAWSEDCPCDSMFGHLLVQSPLSVDAVIDVPDTAWVTASLQNNEPNVPHMCKPLLSVCESVACTFLETSPSAVVAEMNRPSAAAPLGAGFGVTAVSESCSLVPIVNDPANWKPSDEPINDLRGNLEVCSDCL